MPALGARTFAVIWAGQVVSQTGTAMTRFALLIWVYEQTGRATDVALLGFFSFVPMLLLSPLAGVWVDRLDRRLIMLAADGGAGLMTASILALYAAGRLEVWHLYAAEALVGAFEAFQIPAYTAATTMLLPPRHYGRAAGLRSIATLGADGLAPILGGLVLVGFGIAGVMAIDIVTCLAAVLTLAAVRVPRPAAPAGGEPGEVPRRRAPAELATATRYILARPGLVGLLLILMGVNLFGALTYYSILPAMVLARTGGDRLALASVQGVLGGAGVVGGLVMSVWGGPRRKIHGVLALAAVSFLLGDVLFAVGRSVPVWIAAAFVSTVLVPIIGGSDLAIWQARVPPGLQGRVFALRGMVRTSAMPLGYLAGGVLADRWAEPAMAPGGWLTPWLGPLVGVGPGAGIAAMFLATAVLGTAVSLAGYLVPAVRRVEDDAGEGR